MSLALCESTGLVDLMDTARNRERNSGTEQSFYSGNGNLIDGESLQDLAEHLGSNRCMDYLRRAFADILNGLDMPDNDKNYYRRIAGVEE
jgi:hypothetical protein